MKAPFLIRKSVGSIEGEGEKNKLKMMTTSRPHVVSQGRKAWEQGKLEEWTMSTGNVVEGFLEGRYGRVW
jgi:hypothetical protein